MSNEQFITILAVVLGNTAAIVWWAATLSATVKSHDRRLKDHERRLREVELRRAG